MFRLSWLAAECFIPQLGGEDQAAATPGAVSARNTPCLVEAAGMSMVVHAEPSGAVYLSSAPQWLRPASER